jgi:hypothetical protein
MQISIWVSDGALSISRGGWLANSVVETARRSVCPWFRPSGSFHAKNAKDVYRAGATAHTGLSVNERYFVSRAQYDAISIRTTNVNSVANSAERVCNYHHTA